MEIEVIFDRYYVKFNEYKPGFEWFQYNLWNFDQKLVNISSKYIEFQQIFSDSILISGIFTIFWRYLFN